MLLQWHITDKCNLRCAHCYQESYAAQDQSFEKLENVVDHFIQLCAAQDIAWARHQITVTGGEPFAFGGIFRLLEHLAARKNKFRFALLSNGTMIDHSVARALRKLGPAFVQVSIEGDEATHDQIRGSGSHAKAVEGLMCLAREGVPSMISFTAHRGNYRAFPDVVRLGQDLGVRSVWADRLIPYGSGEAMRSQSLDSSETIAFFKLMHEAKHAVKRNWRTGRKMEVKMNRALQFLVEGNRPYQCEAGRMLVTILPNGDLLPCRRMPICVGNVFETPLVDLYYNAPVFKELRSRACPSACSGCSYRRLCAGGLKCLAYALNGDAFSGDPGCPYAHGSVDST